jgi:hypothetical protein
MQERSWKRLEAIAALAVALLVGVAVAAIARRASVFHDYSARFGELSSVEFEALNAEMDRLELLARAAVLTLIPADLLLFVLSLRAWSRGPLAKLAFGFALLVALGVALLLMLAMLPVGPGMIG